MSLASHVYSVYQQLYDESTDEYWEEFAENLGYSIDILKDIFQPKDDEYEQMQEFINEYLAEKVMLRELLNMMEERGSTVIEVDVVRNAFVRIMAHMEIGDIQEIIDDEEEYYFGVGLCEAILMALEEALITIFQEEGH